MTKVKEKDFRKKLRNPGCTMCSLHSGADNVCLMGHGPAKAKIMVVGEAPGAQEDDEGIPFIGRSGELLNKVLDDLAGLKREDLYVTNVAKCRPPDNRTPERREVKMCVEQYFWQEVRAVKPKFMLLLGNSALQGVMKKSGITKQNGTVWEHRMSDGNVIQIMATLHPAAVLRNPKYGDTFLADIARFGRLVRGEASDKVTKTQIVRTVPQLKWLIRKLMEAKVISWDIETYTHPTTPPYVRTNFQEWHGKHSCIVSVSFTWEAGQAAVLPLHHANTPWKNPDAVWEALRPAMTRTDCKYVGHNGKFDARWAHAKGYTIPQTFDTMLAAHMLDENRPKGLKPLSKTILGADAYDVGEELGNAFNMPLRKLCIYNGKDTDYTFQLYKHFRPQLVEDQRSRVIFQRLMMPASEVLVDIERHGVWVDPVRWKTRHDEAQANVEKLYRYINQFVPDELRPINLNSPQQVGKWLFDHLGLPVLETTDKGGRSTREAVLLRLEKKHKATTALMKYRKWAKFLSTYILPWWYEWMDKDGRIHSNYKLYGTVTGRISGEGGIQQVPRDPFIRSIIGAPPGWTFLQADYSQVELRIAAMIAGERRMLRQYIMGEDIHMIRACKMTGKLPEDVTKEERKKAKAVNFGYIYGMGYRKFVSYAFENYGVEVTEDEAKADRDGFFEDYPGLRPWHERQRRLARRYKMVRSPLGRARHLPDIDSASEDVSQEAERQAINSPVQSMASDMMLSALIELHRNHLDPRHARIVGTVHDSILFEVKDAKVAKYAQLIKSVMEDTDRVSRTFGCDITVPIVADIEVGSHWGETKPWNE